MYIDFTHTEVARAQERVIGVHGPGLQGLSATLDNIATVAAQQGWQAPWWVLQMSARAKARSSWNYMRCASMCSFPGRHRQYSWGKIKPVNDRTPQDRFDVGDWIGHLGQVNYPYIAARIMYDSEGSGRPTATEAVESIGGQGRSPFGTGGWSCTRFQEGPPFLG